MNAGTLRSQVKRVRADEGRAAAVKIAALTAVFAALPLFVGSGYRLRIVTLLVVFTLFTVSLNVVFGHTDQLFLFVGGLGAVGAYTSVLVADALGVTPWLTLPLGVAAAGVVGGTVSYIAAKRNFTVILIAIFTLALQLSITEFLVGAREITGGGLGTTVDAGIESDLVFYYLFVAVLVVFLVLYERLVASRFGLAFDVIRQDDVAASSVGVDVVRYKVAAGVFAASMIGVVGALYGFWIGRISPGTFSFQSIDVLVLIMLTLGGMRTTLGPAVGAGVVMVIEEFLASYPHWRLVIFGSLLIVLYLYFREGIVPKVRELYDDSGIDDEPVAGD